jgi:alanyl-tRNA synthetase
VHILNYACRKVLGEHVYQAGAYKDEHKARLDITHFKPLTPEEIKEIERECNRVVAMSLPVEVEVLERADAEKRYGFRIYQGGFIPSGELRIVKIGSFDAQACCGLHVKNTGDVKGVLITSVSKLQDSVVRIEIVAGKRFEELVERFERAREMFEREAGVDVRKGVALLERIEEIKEVKKKVVPSVSAEEIGKNLYLVYDTELEKEKALKVARELSKGENVVVVYGKSGLIVVACGEESKINASSLLKEILSELRGKGGGRETIAIGKIGEACSREELKEVIASAFGRCV